MPRDHISPSAGPLALIWDAVDAARYLRVHPRTITRMAKRGELPAIHIGRLWRFRKADLDAWLDTRTSAAALDTR